MTNPLREMRDALMKTMSPKVLPVELVGGVVRLMRALAHGRPLTLGQASDALGVEADDTPAVLDRLEGMGMLERDGDGRVTGIVITTLPTSHRFQVGDVTLYTWCALDTFFMPAVLDSSGSLAAPTVSSYHFTVYARVSSPIDSGSVSRRRAPNDRLVHGGHRRGGDASAGSAEIQSLTWRWRESWASTSSVTLSCPGNPARGALREYLGTLQRLEFIAYGGGDLRIGSRSLLPDTEHKVCGFCLYPTDGGRPSRRELYQRSGGT